MSTESVDGEALDGEALDGEALDGEALDGEAVDGEGLDSEGLDSEGPDGEGPDGEAGTAAGATRILLRGLRVQARVGWGEEERLAPQLLLLDLDLTLDAPATTAVADTDDLADTVDYAGLAGRVATIVSGGTRRLLEAVAADVLAEVVRDRRVDAATVTVHKPRAPLPVAVDDVAVVRSYRRTAARAAARAPARAPARPPARNPVRPPA